jgi:hypothetical protein
MVTYTYAKTTLKAGAKYWKLKYRDKPAIRQAINDHCDHLIRELSLHHSEAMMRRYEAWLSNLAGRLHPKDKNH